jgi:ammonia channel protein AmtB
VIDLLIFLLRPALKCVEGGSRSPLNVLAALVAWVVDICILHTTWRLIAGPPQGSERTISDTLERLCKDSQNPDYELFRQLALKINRVAGRPHIKAVTN